MSHVLSYSVIRVGLQPNADYQAITFHHIKKYVIYV